MLVRRAVEGSGRYPAVARRLRVEGRAVVKIRVDGAGRVTSVSLSETSDHAALDDAAVAFARRVPSLPPPPGGPIEVMVPVVFALR
jgi:protein TonB